MIHIYLILAFEHVIKNIHRLIQHIITWSYLGFGVLSKQNKIVKMSTLSISHQLIKSNFGHYNASIFRKFETHFQNIPIESPKFIKYYEKLRKNQ